MTDQQEWFENWFDSPFYPILYRDRNMEEAANFVANLMGFLKPPPRSRILDIACGEGRFALQLESYGHDVTGIDLSKSRIEAARRMEHERLHFYVHDMRRPFYTNYFDYAFNFFTSFGYFETQRDNQLAARSFISALKPGGTLVIDYFNKYPVMAGLQPSETIERGPYTFHIRKFIRNHKIIKEIRVQDLSGTEHSFREQVSAFDLEDFISFFNESNMDRVETFGNYRLEPFEENTSPRLILIFRKKAA